MPVPLEAMAKMLLDIGPLTPEDQRLVDQAMECAQSPGFNDEQVKNIRYDPTVTFSYGMWKCPSCGLRFCGGGKALHEADCADRDAGYQFCIFLFGDEAISGNALLPAGVTQERMEQARKEGGK